jgi:hypothetical protein
LVPFIIVLDEKNNIKATIDTISYSEFPKNAKPLKWIEPKINDKKDSIFLALRKGYPNLFIDSSACLILNGSNEVMSLCNDTSSTDFKGWVTYSIYDYKFNYLFFRISYYEGEEFILFNPQNKIIKTLWHYPSFNEDQNIFSVINYDGLADRCYFSLQSLNKNDLYSFYVPQWEISNFFYLKNKFYFEFSSMDRIPKKKYIRIILDI